MLHHGLQFSLIQLQSYVQIDIAQDAPNSSTRDRIKALPLEPKTTVDYFGYAHLGANS
jgi:hypothetical protein